MRNDPAWLRECLVRWLAKKPGPAIAAFLRLYEKHHEKPAADALLVEVRAIRQQAPYPQHSRPSLRSTQARRSLTTASMTARG